jgi:hypothetical protein
MTSARKKLNLGYTNGAILFGMVAGVFSQSALVGIAVFVFLVASATYAGDIRLSTSRKK